VHLSCSIVTNVVCAHSRFYLQTICSTLSASDETLRETVGPVGLVNVATVLSVDVTTIVSVWTGLVQPESLLPAAIYKVRQHQQCSTTACGTGEGL
jgi:hypothetical protein